MKLKSDKMTNYCEICGKEELDDEIVELYGKNICFDCIDELQQERDIRLDEMQKILKINGE